MNSNTPQAAAERDGAVLDAALDQECAKITNAVRAIGDIKNVPTPPVPYALFQFYGSKIRQWCTVVMWSEAETESHEQLSTRNGDMYMITLLHPESGNAREQRLADERREKFDADND